jgi:hypothetical protein
VSLDLSFIDDDGIPGRYLFMHCMLGWLTLVHNVHVAAIDVGNEICADMFDVLFH